MPRPVTVALLVLAIAVSTGCGQSSGESIVASQTAPSLPDGAVPSAPSSSIPSADAAGDLVPTSDRLVVRVTGQRPHDASAFTQGLEFDGDRLFESRGLYGQSAMTEIDPATGEVIQRVDLDAQFFAEGMTVIDGRVIQITWQENTAFVYDADTLEQTATFDYDGEGWGLCDQDGTLYMSNGTSTLTQRDPDTFEPITTVTVTLDGAPVERLNELECVGGLVWANVWLTNTIVVIDPDTGQVVSTVDASPVAASNGKWIQEPAAADVLNGIAYDPIEDVWLITGKEWPVAYEVAFDPAEDVASAGAYYPRSVQ